jgi:hypothetical protein
LKYVKYVCPHLYNIELCEIIMGIVFTEWIDEEGNYENYMTILDRFYDEDFDTFNDPLDQFDSLYREQLGRFQDLLESGDIDTRRGITYL